MSDATLHTNQGAIEVELFAEDAPKAPAATQPSQADLEAAFTSRLSNAVMAGSYTMGNGGAPKKDRYTIVSVRKLKDDNWLFQARVQFGNKDVTIPMIIPVKWAGDTPVISVTGVSLMSCPSVVFPGRRRRCRPSGTLRAGVDSKANHRAQKPRTRSRLIRIGTE